MPIQMKSLTTKNQIFSGNHFKAQLCTFNKRKICFRVPNKKKN